MLFLNISKIQLQNLVLSQIGILLLSIDLVDSFAAVIIALTKFLKLIFEQNIMRRIVKNAWKISLPPTATHTFSMILNLGSLKNDPKFGISEMKENKLIFKVIFYPTFGIMKEKGTHFGPPKLMI